MILQSESVAQLMPDLLKAISILKNPPKDTEAFKYKYTNLSTLIDLVKPVLASNNLIMTQPLGTIDNKEVVITTIYHSSGEFIRSYLPIITPKTKGQNDAQDFGSGITYARRYAISSMLFICSEDDTDGNSPMLLSELGRIRKTRTIDEIDMFFSENHERWLKDKFTATDYNKIDTERKQHKQMLLQQQAS